MRYNIDFRTNCNSPTFKSLPLSLSHTHTGHRPKAKGPIGTIKMAWQSANHGMRHRPCKVMNSNFHLRI